MSQFIKKIIHGFFKFVLLFVLFVAIIGITVCGLVGYTGYHSATADYPVTQAVNDVQMKSNYTTLENMPEIYKNAVVSVEDHRFYDHGGLDIVATTRALLRNFFSGDIQEGGSTITQQLAKNLYFSQEQSFRRKLAEVFVAIDLERHFTKDQILEAYINCIYYGNGYYCVHDASVGYFGVVPLQMSNDQATLLAGVPNAPSRYAPTVDMSLARQRQQHVLSAMVAEGYLTEEEALAIPQGY